VLYLPRGVWHQTKAGTCSISLNITYSIPTVFDVLLTHIKQELVQHECMRENVEEKIPQGIQSWLRQFLSPRYVQGLQESWSHYLTEGVNLYQTANKALQSISEFIQD